MVDPTFLPPAPGFLVEAERGSLAAPSAWSPDVTTHARPLWRELLALTKPGLSAQVMVTCGGGILLAPGHVPFVRAVVAIVATAMVVAAANALNSYLERDLDRYMARTRTRPLAARRLDPRAALVLSAVLLGVAMPTLLVAINPMTALLAALALTTYVLVYTPMKQRSALAMWVGAVPGAIPPLMGWTAVRDRIEWPGVVLFAILFCWQIPHFIAIAVFRQEDYARAGHRVLPEVVGDTAVKVHATIWAGLLWLSTLLLYPLHVEGVAYLVAAAVLGAVFFAWTVFGFVGGRGEARKPWARGLFFASLVYLTLLFVALGLGAL